MKQQNIVDRFRITVVILGCSILLLWVTFYMLTSRYMKTSNEKNMEQISAQVLNSMETEFLNMENMAFTLSQSTQVKEFIMEQNPLLYHEKSAIVDEMLTSLVQPSAYVENLIIYSRSNIYSRFMGDLGNTSAAKIFYTIDPDSLPQHIVIYLEGIHYIGYASGIYNKDSQIGTVVLLLKEDTIRNLFSEYDRLDYLKIALAAKGQVIAANDESLEGLSIDKVSGNYSSSLKRKLGITPFELIIASDRSYIGEMDRNFALAATITAVLFGILLVLFIASWNHLFFRPMLSIMGGVEQLGAESSSVTLMKTGEMNFDSLVNKINSMLIRLEEKNRALLEAQFRLKNSEIEKQKSFIILMKKQINAHFTVNVLNIIKLLAEKGEMKKTGEMCDGLSFLLRYANAGDELIGGLEEFFILEKYIAIMSTRYRNKFTVNFDLDDRLDDVKLPRMLVQPIVENSIVHGFKFMEKGGFLNISAVLESGKVVIIISDNGCGMDEAQLSKLRKLLTEAEHQVWDDLGLEHIALTNIQKRVRLYYSGNYGLSVESIKNLGTKVTLTLPVQYKTDDISA